MSRAKIIKAVITVLAEILGEVRESWIKPCARYAHHIVAHIDAKRRGAAAIVIRWHGWRAKRLRQRAKRLHGQTCNGAHVAELAAARLRPSNYRDPT